MTIGWRQFNNVTSNFRQGGWGHTTDGGLTWHFPGILQNNVFRSDPVLGADETGRFFYLSLLGTLCEDMWRSLNGGMSWTRLSSMDGGARGGDKQWFTIDKTNGPGHGFQYQSWDTSTCGGTTPQFSRSTDGGVTWPNPINLPNSIQFGTLDVDTNGNLFIGGQHVSGSGFWCVRSSNAQNGAVTPTFDRITPVNLGGDLVFGGINSAGICGQSFLVIDHSGGPTNNNIYMVASVLPTGGSTGTEVMFARSTDGGQTFSVPIRVNDDHFTPGRWHWFGTMAVAPNGRLDAVWYDTRNSTNNTDSQLFYAYSTDAGVTWSSNVAVSPMFNPLEGYPNQNKIGDYITVVSDNTGGAVAYSATFNFNAARGQHEEDIYYVHVQPPDTIPVKAVSRKVHGGAGPFDIDLPLTGRPGVESRGQLLSRNDFQVQVEFPGSVNVAGSPQAQVTSGMGCVGSNGVCNGTVSISGNIVTVPLTNVDNAQTVIVTLNGVNGAVNVNIPMSVLVGDANGNGAVNATDVALVKSRGGQPVDATNFRSDVNANGTINATDTALTKSAVGTALP